MSIRGILEKGNVQRYDNLKRNLPKAYTLNNYSDLMQLILSQLRIIA